MVCKHKRYGTLLYSRNGDLLRALSKALGKQKQQRSEATIRQEYRSVVSTAMATSHELTEDTILQVCEALNGRINKQTKRLIEAHQSYPLICATFNPDTMLHELDPLLVQCIQFLTNPAWERRRLFSHQDLLDSSGVVKAKSMKQLYCLSTLFFCSNSQCNMPLQYLLANAVLCLGGSTALLELLNRIGAVASLDTHDRIATCAVKDRISKEIQSELAPRTLTISSIDNIDIMQRHAMVSTAQSKRSWHGTSVQCVQPMPKSIVLTEEIHGATNQQAGESVETSAKESTVVVPSKHSSSSPTMSPALKQVEKGRRTLREAPENTSRTVINTHNHTTSWRKTDFSRDDSQKHHSKAPRIQHRLRVQRLDVWYKLLW